MAIVTATITVDFTSNYIGQHRVCWRIGSSGAYDCTTIVTCPGGGGACSATISVDVDNETCDQVEFEGYVQALCQELASTNGRIPFSVTFTPSPSCTSWRVTCASVGVASITVDSGSSTYDDLNPPAVSITGGGGTGATATAVSSGGVIVSITLDNPGSGYTSVPAVVIDGPGGGVPAATATAVLDQCDGFSTTDCIGSPGLVEIPADTIELGTQFNLCKADDAPTVPDGYTIESNGNCLCDCVTTEVTNTSGPDSTVVYYMGCGGEQVVVPLVSAGSFTACMVADSIFVEMADISDLTIVVGAVCE